MTSFDHHDPDDLLQAYVELAVDIFDKDPSKIDVDVPIDELFNKNSHWRIFSNRSLELAQLSSDEACAFLGESYSGNYDAAWRAEIKSLATLAAFSDSAKELLDKKQEKLELATLRSLAATYATRVFHPSGVGYKYYEPKTRKTVLLTGFRLAITILFISAFATWWDCSTSNCGQRSFESIFLFILAILGLCCICYVGAFFGWGYRALRREAKDKRS